MTLLVLEVKLLFVSESVVDLPIKLSDEMGSVSVVLEAGAGAFNVVVLVTPSTI